MKHSTKTKEILWNEIKIGDEFLDGSIVKNIHETYEEECYKLYYSKSKSSSLLSFNFSKIHEIILSSTHLLLCDISEIDDRCKKIVKENFSNYRIPTLYNKHVYIKNIDDKLDDFHKIVENSKEGYSTEGLLHLLEETMNDNSEYVEYEVVESDISNISDYEYWLPVNLINFFVRELKELSLKCNGMYFVNSEYEGVKEVFCVETDTHKFETNDLIHHNSVTLRNIIFHCLTHGEQISLALIDLKYTEFSVYKGYKDVVAVANTVREACEIMRIARECMYKRNQELSKLKLDDIKKFKPKKATDYVIVAGRKLHDSQEIEIKTKTGEIKRVTVKELEGYLD